MDELVIVNCYLRDMLDEEQGYKDFDVNEWRAEKEKILAGRLGITRQELLAIGYVNTHFTTLNNEKGYYVRFGKNAPVEILNKIKGFDGEGVFIDKTLYDGGESDKDV